MDRTPESIPEDVTNSPGDELALLIPYEDLFLSTQEAVRVHEYSFVEGMRVDRLAGGLIQRLEDLFLPDTDPPQDFRMSDLIAAFGAETGVLTQLLAMACDREEGWVESLGDADGQLLLLAWWTVNRDFFVRRLVIEAGARMARHRAGAESSPD